MAVSNSTLGSIRNPCATHDIIVHGKVNDHYDHRVGPDLSTEWDESNMDPSTIAALIAENRALREELFVRHVSSEDHIHQVIAQKSHVSTTDIYNAINAIVRLSTKRRLSVETIYDLCYEHLTVTYGIDFSKAPQDTSPLTWIWEIGALPFMAIYLTALRSSLIQVEKLRNKTNYKAKTKPPF